MDNVGLPSPPPGLPVPLESPDSFRNYLDQAFTRAGQSHNTSQHHLELFHRATQERDQAFADLYGKFQDLIERYARKSEDYDNEVESRRNWHRKALQLDKQLNELQRSTDSNPFAVAIIDGDGAVFRDDLITRGEAGGVEAAQLLLVNIKSHLKELYPYSNIDDWNILVQVTIYLPGLAKTLYDVGIIKTSAELANFARGFNFCQSLFSIVDVGKGKERTDQKCRELARFMARASQCKHIFFGPCHDRGYVPFLQGYSGGASVAPPITLVETTPALPGFRDLGFEFTKFDVFRSSPLPKEAATLSTPPYIPAPLAQTRQPSTQVTASPLNGNTNSGPAKNGPVQNGSAQNTMVVRSASSPVNDPANSSSWAAMSKTGSVPTGTINIGSKKPTLPKYYLINKYNERVDQELPRCNPTSDNKFKARVREHGNHCNFYHLRNDCEEADYCGYYHGDPISPGETLVLRHKARSLICPMRSECKDMDCFFGHHCKAGKNCSYPGCRFSDMHHIDTTPCYRVYEDGTTESIG